LAGEYIDLTLGVTMGISTMAAAALGNLVSDVAGVGLGGVVEVS
jgi:Transmembrane protein 65